MADILPYYGNMTHFFYPLQPFLPLKFDPIKTIYLPESLRDVCMLNAIVTTAAYRLQGTLGWQSECGAIFYQTAIREMQKRISSGDITDAILMATTCFVLRDYCQGQIDESQLHVNGMLRMLDVRGGMANVYPGFRQKIYRALLGPAIDFLSTPRWPRPQRDRPSLYSTFKPELYNNFSFDTLLLRANLHPTLTKIMSRLHQLSLAINHAVAHSTAVDPFSLDQDIMTVQHDLLCLNCTLSVDLGSACLLGALVFTRLLTRERPLALLNSETLPTAMTKLMGTITILPETATLRFWCFFMGALAAQQTNRRLLLIGDLRGSCIALRISTWDAARACLTKVAWIAKAFESDGKMLWQQLDFERQ